MGNIAGGYNLGSILQQLGGSKGGYQNPYANQPYGGIYGPNGNEPGYYLGNSSGPMQTPAWGTPPQGYDPYHRDMSNARYGGYGSAPTSTYAGGASDPLGNMVQNIGGRRPVSYGQNRGGAPNWVSAPAQNGQSGGYWSGGGVSAQPPMTDTVPYYKPEDQKY